MFSYEEDKNANPTLFWVNPWNGQKESLAHFYWPTHGHFTKGSECHSAVCSPDVPAPSFRCQAPPRSPAFGEQTAARQMRSMNNGQHLDDQDRKWIDALRPYSGGGIVPYWLNSEGYVDAERTLDSLMRAKGACKLDPKTGREIPWPPIEGVVK